MFDVIVVGTGLFGSTIAHALAKDGASVLTIDDLRPDSGSRPAACLMRPSWFSGLGKEVYDPALETLSELFGVEEISFKVLKGNVSVFWCDPRNILLRPSVQARVTKIEGVGSGYEVSLLKHEPMKARAVVLATGVWAPQLARMDELPVGQAGMACLWPNATIDQPFIHVWAPYKQVTAFNRGDGLWVGDSNSVRWDKWSESSAQKTERRCSVAINQLTVKPQRLFGVRPYVNRKPCYLEEANPNFWVATGGAKNGTIAAAWCAHKLRKILS